ncbi:MAG: HAD-superfamily hydrolase, subfamily variant 1 [Candidatus Saccharibacteria bacterium]|nr:HAD-superfamily hydrolase, subfamily variant 1 [Candidatus Saccharibacteria bacterium]
MVKVIVFDFDGTIANSFDVFVETLEELLKLPTFTTEEIDKLRVLSIPEILKALAIKKWQIPKFVLVGRRRIAGKMNRVNIFDGMDDVLKGLSAKGYKLYILSTNSKDAIISFLEKNEISQYIDGVYGDIGLTGKTKYLNKLCRDVGYEKSDYVYVGDELRDIAASKKAHMSCVSVTWGYSNAESLARHNPNGLVSSPTDLLRRFSPHPQR